MSPRNRILIRGLAGLAVVWLLVFGIARVAGSRKPTLEKLEAYSRDNPLSEIEDAGERKEVIGKIADMLNAMDAEEIGRLAEREGEDPRRGFFEGMSPEEQLFFLERRVGRAFEQMMQSFNAMDREERRRIVERSLRQMKQDRDNPDRLEERDPELAERIAEAGLQAYYSEATVETKIDLAPLLEEMQATMSRLGGPPR